MNSRRSGSATGGLRVPRPSRTSALTRLDAEDGAQAAAADGAAAVVDDAREQHAALAGGADDGGLRPRVQLAEPRQRRGDVEPPEAGGGAQRRAAGAVQRLRRAGRRSLAGPVEADGDVARLVQRTGHDQVVPAEAAEGVAEVAAGVAVEHRAGERRAAGHAVAAARRRAGAGQRAGRDDQQVLGPERLHLVQPLAQRDVRAQPAPAEPAAGDLGRQLFLAAGAGGEIETEAAERPKS